VAKFVWLGQKLGLTDKPKDDEDDNKMSLEPAPQPPNNVMLPPVTQPISSYPPPNTAFGPRSAAAAMFTAPKKQPLVYNGAGTLGGNETINGTESPLTKRAASAYRQ